MTDEEIYNIVSKNNYSKKVAQSDILGNIDEADSFLSTYENVVYSPNQIKSVDPVTYFKANDPEVVQGQFKAGDIIPLRMRDNFNRNDVRFSWIPWILAPTTVFSTTQQ